MPILKVVKFSDNVRYTFLHPFLTMKNPPLLIDFGMKCCIFGAKFKSQHYSRKNFSA